MKNTIYSEAVKAYNNGIITLSELTAYLAEYGMKYAA